VNIFYLDRSPQKAALYHADKHVVKMILETAQLLSTAHRVLDGKEEIVLNKAGARMRKYVLEDTREAVVYKSTHVNHPSAIWVRENSENYMWALSLLESLLDEYNFRYGKKHATSLILPYLKILPHNIKHGGFTPPTLAIPNEFIVEGSAIESYRNYYKTAKSSLLQYTKRNKPEWI
jgi:hypothetical protein